MSRPRSGAADWLPRGTAAHRGRRGGRRSRRGAVRAVRGAGRRRGGTGHRRLRARREAGAHLPARSAGPGRQRPDQHRRRAADGHAGRRRPSRHARGVVGGHDRRRGTGSRSGSLAGQLRADPPALHHGQRRWCAVHERGGELQRAGQRVPRGGRGPVRLRQPSGLAADRPPLPVQVRAGRVQAAGADAALVARGGQHWRAGRADGRVARRPAGHVQRWNAAAAGGHSRDGR